MFLEIILAILLGVASGIFTGLIPGVHINLISALLVGSAPIIIPAIGIYNAVTFIIAMSVTHTFIDVIPSIYLGAPDPDMVLGVLPGHRLLLEGRGLEAVRLTQLGSLGAVILSVILFPLFVTIIKLSENFLKDWLPQLLLGLVLFLLLQSKKINAIILFLLSGILGYLVLNFPGLKNPLFPLLTGLFGISTLLLSLQNIKQAPKQNYAKVTSSEGLIKAVLVGQASGFLTAVFPGLGSASAAALSSAFVNLKERSFLILIGSIGTVNFILSLITYYVYDKARNGSIVAVKELFGTANLELIVLCIFVSLIAGGFASLILTKFTKPIAETIMRFDYKKLVIGIISFLIILTTVLSGSYGLMILLVAGALGMLAPLVNVQRIYLMGCLLVPVLIYLV